MIEALKKVLNQKKDDNFAIVIAKLGEEESPNKMDGQAPPAKEHKEMVGDDAVDKSMVDEEHKMSPVEEGIMGKDDDQGGLIAKVKEMLMKSKKKV